STTPVGTVQRSSCAFEDRVRRLNRNSAGHGNAVGCLQPHRPRVRGQEARRGRISWFTHHRVDSPGERTTVAYPRGYMSEWGGIRTRREEMPCCSNAFTTTISLRPVTSSAARPQERRSWSTRD